MVRVCLQSCLMLLTCAKMKLHIFIKIIIIVLYYIITIKTKTSNVSRLYVSRSLVAKYLHLYTKKNTAMKLPTFRFQKGKKKKCFEIFSVHIVFFDYHFFFLLRCALMCAFVAMGCRWKQRHSSRTWLVLPFLFLLLRFGIVTFSFSVKNTISKCGVRQMTKWPASEPRLLSTEVANAHARTHKIFVFFLFLLLLFKQKTYFRFLSQMATK